MNESYGDAATSQAPLAGRIQDLSERDTQSPMNQALNGVENVEIRIGNVTERMMFIVERLAGPRPRPEGRIAKNPSEPDQAAQLYRLNTSLQRVQTILVELEDLTDHLDRLL